MKSVIYKGNKTIQNETSEVVKPEAGEVRLNVAYCGICGTDMHIYHGAMDARVGDSQILGHEVSATVAELGEGVDNVKVGDPVAVRPLKFGEPHPFDKGQAHVGKNLKFIGIDLPGGMQASWTVPAYTLHKLPEGVSLDHGALAEPLAVACHDVRLGKVIAGENCVVIGGGPIGMLVALVAKSKGATVVLSEVNEERLEMARGFGLKTVNPVKEDLVETISAITDTAMADVVFEVSGSAAGVNCMTDIANARGRIVMVAIHPEPRPVNLFKFFWSELQLIGTRLYEAEDFEEAISYMAAETLPLKQLITKIYPIEEAATAFAEIDENPNGIKSLVRCS